MAEKARVTRESRPERPGQYDFPVDIIINIIVVVIINVGTVSAIAQERRRWRAAEREGQNAFRGQHCASYRE